MNYAEHITTQYDEGFAKVKMLKWYPWVGKNYAHTEILILGMIPYTNKKENLDKGGRDDSRNIVGKFTDGTKRFEHKPHKAMSKMFLTGAGKKHNHSTIKVFWESVAFHNFSQEIGFGRAAKCASKDIPAAREALIEILKILKPKLVIAWSNQVTIFLPSYRVCTKIGVCRPRVIEPIPSFEQPIMGIRHPSSYFNKTKWLTHLREDPASEKPVKKLLAHLTQTIN